MTDNGVHLDRIRQIAIRVLDLDRAIAFYRDVLGMRFLFRAPPGLGFFDCGGIRLMLSVSESPETDHPSSILYYSVSDIEGAHATLESRGVTFEAAPHVVHRAEDYDLWLGFFHDTEGNPLALMAEVPRP